MTKNSLETGPSKSFTSHSSQSTSPTFLSFSFNNLFSSLEEPTSIITSLVGPFSNVSLSKSFLTGEQIYFLKSTYLQNIEDVGLIVQRLQNRTLRQDLQIARLAHTVKLGIAQQFVLLKVNYGLLKNMRYKKEQGKISQIKVYKMRHLDVQEAEALHAKEKKKEQDTLCKNQAAEAQKLVQERKKKEKEERIKKTATQKVFFELEKAQKSASKLEAKEKKVLRTHDDNLCKICAMELFRMNVLVFQ